MDPPAMFTGTLRINQTVGKTQPAILPLSRLNCHFISFIYGGSALFWTPPLSVLPLKMLLFFFFLFYIVLWQPTYTPVLLSSPFFPGILVFSPHTHIIPGTSPCLSLFYVIVVLEPVIFQWTKSWTDSDVHLSVEGLSPGWAFNIRCKSTQLSTSFRAVFELADQQQFTSGLTAQPLSEKTAAKKQGFVLEERERFSLFVLARKD